MRSLGHWVALRTAPATAPGAPDETARDPGIRSAECPLIWSLCHFIPYIRTDRLVPQVSIRLIRSDGDAGPVSSQTLDVVVLNKRLDVIQIVLGEDVHNVRCDLILNRSGSAYVGNATGREIVYERSREDVKADLARVAGFRDFKR